MYQIVFSPVVFNCTTIKRDENLLILLIKKGVNLRKKVIYKFFVSV